MPAWVSSPVHRSVIEALIAARKAAGLTQRDVALRLGKPPSFVGKVESIERNLSILEFLEWGAALEISPEELICRARKGVDNAF
jgi:transcriptional regulator with XRE-family HTH domain